MRYILKAEKYARRGARRKTIFHNSRKRCKRRPGVVLSSATYHATRPDVIIGLITTQTTSLGITDFTLQDWAAAGLRVASVFRSFIVTLPPSANLVLIGQLSELDWKGVRACVKIALAELDDSKPSSDASSAS